MEVSIKEFTPEKRIRTAKGKSLISSPSEYTVLDIETTGFDYYFDKIIEIGAIKYKDGIEVARFNELIKPEDYFVCGKVGEDENDIDNNDYVIDADRYIIYYIDDFIVELTGITNNMLHNAHTQRSVLSDFIKFISDDTVFVGHNINFDINFLYDALDKEFHYLLSNDFVDTMRLSRRLLKKELKHHRLIDLVKHYNIDSDGFHRSILDCSATNKCYINLITDIKSKYESLDLFKKETQSKPKKLNVKDIVSTMDEFDESNPIFGKVCVFTGTLKKMERRKAMQFVVDLGGKNGSNVTRETNYLILGMQDYTKVKGGKSSKQKKAEKLKLNGVPIEIISENTFYDLIELED